MFFVFVFLKDSSINLMGVIWFSQILPIFLYRSPGWFFTAHCFVNIFFFGSMSLMWVFCFCQNLFNLGACVPCQVQFLVAPMRVCVRNFFLFFFSFLFFFLFFACLFVVGEIPKSSCVMLCTFVFRPQWDSALLFRCRQFWPFLYDFVVDIIK